MFLKKSKENKFPFMTRNGSRCRAGNENKAAFYAEFNTKH